MIATSYHAVIREHCNLVGRRLQVHISARSSLLYALLAVGEDLRGASIISH